MTETQTRTRERIAVEEAPQSNLPATRERARASNGSPPVGPDRGAEGPATQVGLPSRPASSAAFQKIAEAIAAVMSELQPVAKEGTNTFHGYKYPRMGDILAELTPLMGKHGLAIIPSEAPGGPVFENKYVYMRYVFTILHSSGEIWAYPTIWTGMSLAYTNNGSFDDKCLNKCSVGARKFFLQALYNLPTEDAQDADRGDNDARPAQQKKQEQPKGPYRMQGKQWPTALTWARGYMDALKTSRSLEELYKWDELNDDIIEKVRHTHAKAYNAVVDAYNLIKAALTPPPPPQEPPKPPAATVQTGTDIPTYEKDPDGYITWVDAVAARYTTYEALNEWWNTKIIPGIQQLMPPDEKLLTEIYLRNVKRLNDPGDSAYGG